jgi:prepilin-type N-terminal cleavage/methylation domain-containing protein
MKRRQAFTLVEMLVVVAIIAILAALLLPALSMAKQKSYRTQCINNLKQMSIAFQNYADDHGDQLPGPVWQGFYEEYDNQDYARLLYYVATYLGQPAPTLTPQDCKLAQCPSAAGQWTAAASGTYPMSLQVPLSYIVSVAITNINSEQITRPFGYPYSSPPWQNPNDEPPKHLREIATPSLSWAMTDADQQNAFRTARYFNYLPKTPCHGNIRNELFFDWHVTGVPK